MTPRLRHRFAALALVALGLGAAVPAGAATPAESQGPQGRLLVVSLPGLTWSDVASQELPAMEGFFEDAALANLAPRSVSAKARPGNAYLTISAGSRAAGLPSVDGQVLGLTEKRLGAEAQEIFRRRTGVIVDGEFVVLHWPRIVRTNQQHPYDAVLGLLQETLEENGIGSAVIGNADGTDTTSASYERQVGLALADRDGVVARGELGPGLRQEDPPAPYGVRLDTSAAMEEFDRHWGNSASERESGAKVVMVEGSDLARVLDYRSKVSSDRFYELWDSALADSDELFGRLMERVDPEMDSVLVVAPYNLRGSRNLTVAALRTPGGVSGYLKSASTQRAGFLTLVDIAPTVLDVFGVPRPIEMEGRRAEVSPVSLPFVDRVDHLVSSNRASRFRERLLVPTSLAIVLTMALAAVGTVVVLMGRLGARWRRGVAFAVLGTLTVFPASYLARLFSLEDLGLGFYWAFVLAAAAGTSVVASVLGARSKHAYSGLVLVLSMVAGVLVFDVMTGSRLSLGAAFGYSPTGNSRLYGISNYSYGQLATATCLLAAVLAARFRGTTGRAASVGLLVAALIVMGVPIWGSDVGGILAFTPTILVFVTLLQGRKIRWRTVVGGAAATTLAVAAFGLLDLARPAERRTHLGRLIERVMNEGFGPLYSIVERKLVANLQVSVSSFWVATIPLAVAFWLFLVKVQPRSLARVRSRLPTLDVGLASATVAAVLGSLVNDSGAIIAGVAASMLTLSLAYLVLVHSAEERE
ncbi:MAG: hypothetical protein WD602_11055 [Actinomycetota bacterium]